VWARFLNIVCLIATAGFVYRWQIRFNTNRVLAVCFAIAAFTLPAYQVFVATANYFCILAALLMTIVAVEGLWQGLARPYKRSVILWSSALYMVGLMTYQLSSMFAWIMLVIAYLQVLTDSDSADKKEYRNRVLIIAAFVLGMMALYFVLGSLLNLLVKNPGGAGRKIGIDISMWPKLVNLWLTALWHSELWFWRDTSATPWPFIAIVALFLTALWTNVRRRAATLWASFIAIACVCFAFAIAYAPVLAPAAKDFQVSFRYGIATMPLLLFVSMWAIWQIASHFAKAQWAGVFLVVVTTSTVVLCNLWTEHYIVGPQDRALRHVRERLEAEAVPLIHTGKSVTVAIQCNFDPPAIHGYVAPRFEYGMRIWQYQEQCVSAIVHGLRMAGIETTLGPPHEMVHDYRKNLHIVKTKWGTIVATHKKMTAEEIVAVSHAGVPVIALFSGEEGEYVPFAIYRSRT
jgi:hypothetical protein